MNWDVIVSYLPLYKDGLLITLYTGWFGILISIVLGLVTALILHFKVPVLKTIAKIYIEVLRNTPLLIQLFFIYYGIPKLFGIVTDEMTCGIIGLGLLGGAYMAEAFRLLKETSVFSCISIMELMFTAKDRIAVSSTTVESLFLVVVFYLIVLLPVSIIGSVVERRLRYAIFGD